MYVYVIDEYRIIGQGRPQGQIAGPARAAGALCRAYGCHPPTLPARAPSGWSQPGQERPLRPARAYFGGLWAMGGRDASSRWLGIAMR